MCSTTKKIIRSSTTISRELPRNQDPYLKTYLPDGATSQAQERRHNAEELFQSFTPQQIEHIRSRLKLYHSPECQVERRFFALKIEKRNLSAEFRYV